MALLVVVLVSAVVWLSQDIARSSATELIRDRAALLIGAVRERTRNHLLPVETQLRYLASYIDQRNVDLGDAGVVGEMLAASLAAAPQVSVVAYVDANFRIVRAFRNRPGEPVEVSDWSDDPELRQTAQRLGNNDGLTWGRLFVAETVGRTFLNVALRLDGGNRGLLLAGVSIEELSEALTHLEDRRTQHSFILYGRDRVLAHPRLVDGFPGLTDAEPLPALEDFDDPVLRRIWSPQRETDVEKSLAGDFTVRAVNIDGDTYVFLFVEEAGFGQTPWLIGSYLTYGDVAAELRRLRLVPVIGLGAVLLALVFAIVLARQLARPVRELATMSAQMRELDFSRSVSSKPTVFREINETLGVFASMVEGLRVFATYVPHTLVRRIIHAGAVSATASEERDVTVLFTDIVGFTHIAEGRPAPEVAAFLNRHFALLAECVESEGGTVDKYVGDAMMAFWGAPDDRADHADAACRAARLIVRAVQEDNLRGRSSGEPPVRVRIGVHSGRVMVGNIGAPGRVNYTIIGDAVNVAERLEQLARDFAAPEAEGFIVTSGETVRRLQHHYDIYTLGQRTVRGRDEPVDVYAVGLH